MDYVSKIHNVNKRALPYLEIENKKKIETNIKYLLLILNFLRTLDFSSHYHCFFFPIPFILSSIKLTVNFKKILLFL